VSLGSSADDVSLLLTDERNARTAMYLNALRSFDVQTRCGPLDRPAQEEPRRDARWRVLGALGREAVPVCFLSVWRYASLTISTPAS
jgi:hypothetical protein